MRGVRKVASKVRQRKRAAMGGRTPKYGAKRPTMAGTKRKPAGYKMKTAGAAKKVRSRVAGVKRRSATSTSRGRPGGMMARVRRRVRSRR